jgi:hypothetical protein
MNACTSSALRLSRNKRRTVAAGAVFVVFAIVILSGGFCGHGPQEG